MASNKAKNEFNKRNVDTNVVFVHTLVSTFLLLNLFYFNKNRPLKPLRCYKSCLTYLSECENDVKEIKGHLQPPGLTHHDTA